MENVEADHIKEARSQDVKMTAEETHWSICADTEPKQEEKHCKGEAVWRRQGRRKRVMKGKERWRRCTVGGEDVTQPLLYTDTFTHKHSYAETLLRTNRHTHTHAHKRLHTPQGFHTHTLLRTNAISHADPLMTPLHSLHCICFDAAKLAESTSQYCFV